MTAEHETQLGALAVLPITRAALLEHADYVRRTSLERCHAQHGLGRVPDLIAATDAIFARYHAAIVFADDPAKIAELNKPFDNAQPVCDTVLGKGTEAERDLESHEPSTGTEPIRG